MRSSARNGDSLMLLSETHRLCFPRIAAGQDCAVDSPPSDYWLQWCQTPATLLLQPRLFESRAGTNLSPWKKKKKRSAISCYLGFPLGSLQRSHACIKQRTRSAVQEQARCWSWAGMLSYLITFIWSAFLLSLKKGGWVEAELRWFWITLLLQLTLELLMQLQKKCLPGTDLQNYCLHMQT